MYVSLLLFTVVCHLVLVSDGRATEEQLDKKLGAGMKHVSCQTRITGYYMRQYCSKQYNSTLRCDLDELERRSVRKVAKLCCEDGSNCEPSTLFDEFCCHGNYREETECQPWKDSMEEIRLANLVYSSDYVFSSLLERIIARVKTEYQLDYFPEGENSALVTENESAFRQYLKTNRLKAAHIAKSYGIIRRSGN